MTIHARRSPPGITLIEVLFAIAILGMISTLVYASFVPTLEVTQRVNRERESQRRTRIVFQRMVTELRGAFLGIYPAANRRNCELDLRDCPYFFVMEDDGDFDEITFTSLAGKPGSRRTQSDQIWLRYYTEKDPDSGLTGLVREERLIHEGNFDDTVPYKVVLFPEVTKFNIRAIEPGSVNDFVDNWDSTRGLDDEETNNLPPAIEVSIAYTDETGFEGQATTVVDLPFSKPLEDEEEQRR